jgi:hypothetical protein
MRAITYFLALALFISNLGDFFTTLIALSFGASESNPLFNAGLEIFFGIKLLIPTLLVIYGLFINSYAEKHKQEKMIFGIRIAFLIPIIVFTCATINNIFVIAQIVQAGNQFRFI